MDIKHPFHAFPVHLFHATKPPIIANDSDTFDKAMADDYTTEYQHRDFPKVVHAEVADADHQAEAAAHGFHYTGDPKANFPHSVSRTFKTAEDFEAVMNPKSAAAELEHHDEPATPVATTEHHE